MYCFYWSRHIYKSNDLLFQVIMNLMYQRPRYDLSAEYFIKIYRAESVIMRQHINLIKSILDKQVIIVAMYVLWSFVPHRSGFEYRQGLWIISCEEAIQVAYGMLVVLLRCPFVPEIIHVRTPQPVKLESPHVTCTVLVCHSTQSNKQNNVLWYKYIITYGVNNLGWLWCLLSKFL
jgi:hypothetical protein